jgi:small-conductance mechanosensitive channel
MLIPAILFYDVVLFVHVLAVVLAFGVVFTYPMLDAYIRRVSPGDLVVLHRFQVFVTRRLITPSMVVVLAAGLYLALDRYSLGDPWISSTFTILIVLFGLVGAVLTPTEKRLAELAEADRRSGGGKPSEAYEAQARKLATFGGLTILLIVVAIFLMTVKPGA